jgi:hypothetical protein
MTAQESCKSSKGYLTQLSSSLDYIIGKFESKTSLYGNNRVKWVFAVCEQTEQLPSTGTIISTYTRVSVGQSLTYVRLFYVRGLPSRKIFEYEFQREIFIIRDYSKDIPKQSCSN